MSNARPRSPTWSIGTISIEVTSLLRESLSPRLLVVWRLLTRRSRAELATLMTHWTGCWPSFASPSPRSSSLW